MRELEGRLADGSKSHDLGRHLSISGLISNVRRATSAGMMAQREKMAPVSDAAPRDSKPGFGGWLSNSLSKGLWPVCVFLALYFMLSIAIRVMLPDSLTLDEAEQSLFSQYLLAGYGPQPPLYNWMQNAVTSLMGVSLLSLTLPKFAILFLCYVFFGLAARELNSRPGFTAMAMLGLLALPQVSYMPQQDLTHTVAVLMATSLFLYGLVRTLKRPDWQGYAITGVAIGIGVISKYNFALLPASALIAVCCDRDWRSRILDARLAVTVLVSLAIVFPHALWLIHNMDQATSGTLTKMVDENAPHGIVRVLRGLGEFVGACLAFGAIVFLIFMGFFRANPLVIWKASDRWTRLLGITMMIALGGVLVIILATGTTKLTERWLDPYLLALPLYLLLKLERAGFDTGSRLRRFMPVFLVIMIVTLLPQAAKTIFAGTTGSYTRINYPFATLAEHLAADDDPALIIASDKHLAGNMRFQFAGVPVIDSNHPIEGFPSADALKGPVLAVWIVNGKKPMPPSPVDLSAISNLKLTASPARMIDLPFYFSNGEARLQVGYMWLR